MANNYAQQLTPEQIQQILAAGQYGTANIGGLNYGLSGLEQNNEGGIGFTPQSILGYQPGDVGKAGASRAEYGLGGGFSQMGRNESPSMKDIAVPLAAAASMFFGPEIMAAMQGAGGAAAADGAMGMGSWGAGGLGGAAGAGADFGLGAGFGGADALGAGGIAFDGGGDLGAVGGGDAVSTMPYMDPFTDTLAKGSLVSEVGGAGLPGWASTLLKYGAPIVGGLLGSKGVTKTQTQQTNLPSYLQPYVTGQGGLLGSANDLFQKQTAPGGMPGYPQMQAVGQGLLNQPIAGNGFGQFQAMPRFGVPR